MIPNIGKLHCLTDDISKNQLGLNTADEKLLMKPVNIIIYSAARFWFSEPMQILTNNLQTKSRIPSFKVF